jgi:hypothetical protein
MDVVPLSWVSAVAWWRAFCVGAVIEEFVKLAVIWELFSRLKDRPPLAKSDNRLFLGTGATLVVIASLAAVHTPMVHRELMLISRTHVFVMAAYVVLSGLILFLFVFAAYRGLTLGRRSLGIGLGFGIVWCEHMATWALIASGTLIESSYLLDFLNTATYHVCVLIWFYYLLFLGAPRSYGNL